jgi:hypothetical protein
MVVIDATIDGLGELGPIGRSSAPVLAAAIGLGAAGVHQHAEQSDCTE